MCYIIVKKFNKHNGCVAFETETGPKLARLKTDLEKIAKADKNIEVVIISSTSMYSEYAPYSFVHTKKDLIEHTKKLAYS